MKISGTSNNSFQNKVLIDTFIEQISALQTDVGNLQIADDNLAQALATKANTADINTAVNTGTLTSTNGNIKTLNVQGTGSSATIENATIGTASIGTETVTQSNITNLEVMDVDTGTVRTGTLTVENDATISGNVAVQDVSAKDITSASVNTLNLTTAEADVNKLEAQNAEITGKLEVNDLEVSGNFTGVSNIETESVEAESVTADTAEIETLDVENIRSWVTQVMNQDQILNPPTPALGNVDTYTIELPRFTGVFLLSWEDADVVWSATVIGNGKSYGISWGSRTDQNYITDLFQYNGKLYIRINSNGRLKYAYSATKELDQITIYRNMNGWTSDKSLEELCDELSHIQNAYPVGTAWLGHVTIPRLETSDKGSGIAFKGSCTFAGLPSFSATDAGDVWNITNEAYTDDRFVEGAGKPINAGDDIVAVEVENTDPIITPEDSIDGEYCVFLNMSNGQCLTLLGDSDNNTTKVCIRNDLNEYRQISTINDIYNFACILEGRPGTIIAFPDNYDEMEEDNFIFRSTDFGQTWTKIYISVGVTISWGDHNTSSTREGLFALGASHDYGDQPFYSIDDGLTWNIFDISTPEGYAERYSALTVLNNNTAIFNFCDSDNNHKRMFYIWHNISSTDAPILTKIGEITDSQRNVYEFNQLQLDDTTVLAFGSSYRRESYRIDLATSQMVRITDLPNDGQCYGIVDENRVILSSGYISDDSGNSWTQIIDGETSYWPETNSVYLISHNIYQYRYSDSQGNKTSYSEVKILPNSKVLKWDKFAAGVNYDNFVAKNISATSIKKNNSEVLTRADKGAEYGVASLDGFGKVPSEQLPLIPTVVDTIADENMNAVTSNAVYDGVTKFELVPTNTFTQNTSFPTNYSVYVLIEYNGKLYVGTNNHGIFISDDGNTFTQNTSFPTNYIVNSLIEYNGKLYVGTGSHGIFISDDGNTFTQNTSLPTNYSVPASSLIEYNGKLYVGTNNYGIFISDDGNTFTQNTSFPTNYGVYGLIEYNGKLYAGTSNHGIYVSSDGNTFTQNTSFPTVSVPVLSLIEYNGKLYVGTSSHGIFISDDGNTFTQNTSFPRTYIVRTFIEIGGKLYVGTTGHGIYVSSDGDTFIQNTYFPTDYTVRDFIKIDRKLYVGTTNHGIYQNDIQLEVSPFIDTLSNLFVPKTTTVNGHALSSDISLTASDVGAVNKAGDTITGSISRDSGGEWISGRDNCVVKQLRSNPEGNSWNPVIGVKTESGNWTMGSVGGEKLQLSYDTDANYTAGINDANVIDFPPAGSTGTLALTSQIPTVVDTVADGNMNAVTSNAVYDYIDAAITQVLNSGF